MNILIKWIRWRISPNVVQSKAYRAVVEKLMKKKILMVHQRKSHLWIVNNYQLHKQIWYRNLIRRNYYTMFINRTKWNTDTKVFTDVLKINGRAINFLLLKHLKLLELWSYMETTGFRLIKNSNKSKISHINIFLKALHSLNMFWKERKGRQNWIRTRTGQLAEMYSDIFILIRIRTSSNWKWVMVTW